MRNQTLCSSRQAAELSHTNRQPAFRPWIAESYETDLHTSPAASCCSLRNDPDAGTRLDHAAHRIEACHARADVHCHSQSRCMSNNMSLKRTLAWQADECAIDDIDQGQSSFARYCIPLGNDKNEYIVSEWKLLHIVGECCNRGNTYIRRTRCQSRSDVSALALLDLEVDCRIGGQEVSQHSW